MSLRSANFASLPVLTQDSQGPQTVCPDQVLTPAQILCIVEVIMMITLWVTVSAIPVNITRNVMGQLVRAEKVTRAYMGSFHKMSRLQRQVHLVKKKRSAPWLVLVTSAPTARHRRAAFKRMTSSPPWTASCRRLPIGFRWLSRMMQPDSAGYQRHSSNLTERSPSRSGVPTFADDFGRRLRIKTSNCRTENETTPAIGLYSTRISNASA